MNGTLEDSIHHGNTSFQTFLVENCPEYLNVVSDHWLKQEQPSRNVQVTVSTIFFILSFLGNTCQILVLVAYSR